MENTEKRRLVSSVDSRYNGESIKVEIFITANRHITEDESIEISINHTTKIVETFRRNSLLKDATFLQSLKEEKEQILALFGNRTMWHKELPNGYDDGLNPWFEVYTFKGPIKIGWRKRVILIEWTNSDIIDKAEELFPNEDVTKYDKVIHAWGYEKAREYIDRLLVF